MRGGGRFGSDYKRRLAAKRVEVKQQQPPFFSRFARGGVEGRDNNVERVFEEGLKLALPDINVLQRAAGDPFGTIRGAAEVASFASPAANAYRLARFVQGKGLGVTGADTEDIEQAVEVAGLFPQGKSVKAAGRFGNAFLRSKAGVEFYRPMMEAGETGIRALNMGINPDIGLRRVDDSEQYARETLRSLDESMVGTEAANLGVEGLDPQVRNLVETNPRIQSLLENNPDRLTSLQQLTYDSDTRKRIVGVLEQADKFYDIANTGHVGSVNPAVFTNLSKEAADAIEKGQNPLELLLDNKLSPSDFNVRKNAYSVTYKPLSRTEYGAQQTATSYSGSYRISEITGIPRGSAPRVSDEADLNTRYSEAVEAGFIPHRIEVITPQGKTRTYTPQKEHSIPKSPAGKRLQKYFVEQVRGVKDKNLLKEQKQAKRELDAIINARDTFFDLPPYYNRLKSDRTTDEFKGLLLEGGRVEVKTKDKTIIKDVPADPEAYERFYGDNSPVAEGLRRRQELLTERLYDWGRRNNVPQDLVDDLVLYL
jgi:hypothetical protein